MNLSDMMKDLDIKAKTVQAVSNRREEQKAMNSMDDELVKDKIKKQSCLPKYFQSWLDKIPKSEKILDVGCGYGYTTKWIADNKGIAVGIDDDPITIKKAKDIQQYEYLYCDNFAKLNFRDNNFDSVFCYDALKKEKQVTKALSEINRVLKSGGLFILMMPLYTVVKQLGLYNWMPIDKEEIKTVVAKAGFQILEVEQIDTLEKFGLILTQANNQIVCLKGCK